MEVNPDFMVSSSLMKLHDRIRDSDQAVLWRMRKVPQAKEQVRDLFGLAKGVEHYQPCRERLAWGLRRPRLSMVKAGGRSATMNTSGSECGSTVDACHDGRTQDAANKKLMAAE